MNQKNYEMIKHPALRWKINKQETIVNFENIDSTSKQLTLEEIGLIREALTAFKEGKKIESIKLGDKKVDHGYTRIAKEILRNMDAADIQDLGGKKVALKKVADCVGDFFANEVRSAVWGRVVLTGIGRFDLRRSLNLEPGSERDSKLKNLVKTSKGNKFLLPDGTDISKLKRFDQIMALINTSSRKVRKEVFNRVVTDYVQQDQKENGSA